MVKLFTLLIPFILLTKTAHALNGTITVLEAPLFAIPDDSSKVIQYYRKGQLIYIHPQEAAQDDFIESLGPLVSTVTPDLVPDVLFENNKAYAPVENAQFYKTISRNGKEAYILKEHVFLNYKDPREFNQKIIKHDNTDYRIQEPLPTNYPFKTETGYRGLMQFSLGRPNFQAYPYNENISDAQIDFSKEFNFIWSKVEKTDIDKRFFFGVMSSVHSSSIDYLLENQLATQENIRLSVGPSASYDILRNNQFALNSYLSLQALLYDSMDITIQDSVQNLKDRRLYKSLFSVSGVLGLNAIFSKTLYVFDTVIGSNVRINSSKTYKTVNGGREPSMWNSSSSNDEYFQPFTSELNFYIGLQSDY